MLPLRARVLPLYKLAKHWCHEISGVRQSEEIFGELLSAFWIDELHVTGASGNQVDRRDILKLVNRRRVHPGFSLIERAEDRPGLKRTSSGEVIVDLRRYVVLAADDALWKEELVEATYVQMAKMSFGDFDELVQPGLLAFCTTREALSGYCEAKGYPLPRFWFGSDDDTRWNTRRELEAESWFRQLVKAPKERTRAKYLVEAQTRFRNMPEDAFDRLWTKLAPDAWKKPGPVARRYRG